MPTLESGTLPATGGTAELTGVVSVSPAVTVTTADSLSTTGIFTFSNIRSGLSPTVSVNLPLNIATANSLSTTGIFTYSNIRPALTGVTGISLTQLGTGPQTAAPAQTRQLLIR